MSSEAGQAEIGYDVENKAIRLWSLAIVPVVEVAMSLPKQEWS